MVVKFVAILYYLSRAGIIMIWQQLPDTITLIYIENYGRINSKYKRQTD
jgi:hypothetical protein